MLTKLQAFLLSVICISLLSACGGGGGGGGNSTNHSPVLSTITDVSMVAGNSLAIPLTATDQDNDTVSFAVSGGSTSTVTAAVFGGSLIITPAVGYVTASPITFTVTASDSKGGSESKLFNVTVSAPSPTNHAPVLSTISDVSITAGNSLTISLLATDPDNDVVSFSVLGGSTSTVSTVILGNSLTITPAAGYVTTAHSLVVTASDDKGGTVSKPFNVSVTAPPTKVVVTLATSGTLPPGVNIGGTGTTINYPTTKGLTIAENNVVASGVAAEATLFANVVNSGKIILGNITLGGAGFPIGEFATLTFNIAPGNSPLANDFTVDSGATVIGASDDAATDLSGQLSVIIKSVAFQ